MISFNGILPVRLLKHQSNDYQRPCLCFRSCCIHHICISSLDWNQILVSWIICKPAIMINHQMMYHAKVQGQRVLILHDILAVRNHDCQIHHEMNCRSGGARFPHVAITVRETCTYLRRTKRFTYTTLSRKNDQVTCPQHVLRLNLC